MMQIPRKIPAALMVSGGRVEMFTRCTGDVGKEYILTAGSNPLDPNPFTTTGFGYVNGSKVRPWCSKLSCQQHVHQQTGIPSLLSHPAASVQAHTLSKQTRLNDNTASLMLFCAHVCGAVPNMLHLSSSFLTSHPTHQHHALPLPASSAAIVASTTCTPS